jgi:two-component system LytT family response regulator
VAKIRALIVDDERPARRKIRRFLSIDPDVEVAGESGGGRDAVEAIEREKPDLVFLDVQMPGMDGFSIIDELNVRPMPQIVFVTAHDQFALRAFEVHALDYLLKPFEIERFKQVLDRAKDHLKRAETSRLDERLEGLLDELRGKPQYASRFLINSGGRAFFLQTERIDWIESAKNYVNLHSRDQSFLIRGTIEGLAKKLDPAKFMRVSRSHIVNIDSIKEMQPWFHGEYRIILKDGTEIPWSRRYMDRSSDMFVKQF